MAAVLALVLALGWLVGLPVPAAADGPTTFENTSAIAIPATGSNQQIGSASPYPSDITVSGMTGAVTKVTVTFHDLTHGSANDIDALVVAPGGRNLVIMSDATSTGTFTFATNATVTFDDAAATELPQAGEIDSDSYRPTNRNIGGADSFPSGAPAPSNETTLAGAFAGMTSANGTWSLYVVDDATGDEGSIAGGWSITVTTEVAAVSTTTSVASSDETATTGDSVTFTATVRAGASAVTTGTVQFTSDGVNLDGAKSLDGSGQATVTTSTLAEGTHLIRATYSGAAGFLTSNRTLSQRVDNPTTVNDNTFCNAGPITGPDSGTATPYPSNIFVSGLAGEITKVTAELKGVSHTQLTDFDILLSGPTPSQNLFLLSDVRGTGDIPPVNDVDLTFDDAAASEVPATPISGPYLPSRFDDERADTMPDPAPTPSSATRLSTFNGGSPNGTWSLWVVDDASGDSGSIAGGWCLTIEAQVETTTELTAVPTSSIFGQSVTFTAAVTGAGSPVTEGSVQFKDGATVLGTENLAADGTASLSTLDLAVGDHDITAVYSGTETNAPSTSEELPYVVSLRPTVTAVSSSSNPSDVGESVTFTATVTDAGNPVTAGTVQFSIDGSPVGVASTPNASGQVTYQPQSLAAGTYAVTAAYSGTPDTLAPSSGSLDPDQEVLRLQPSGTLIAVPGSSKVNQSVTFTATFTVDGSPATPGTVDFTDDGDAIVTCSDVSVDGNGVATCTTTLTTAGTHSIVATLAQTARYEDTMANLDYVVGLIPTTTVLTTDPNPSDVGEQVTFNATVTVDSEQVTTGFVQFRVDGTNTGDFRPVNGSGVATYSTVTLTAGVHQISAVYQANSAYAESPSNVVEQNVQLVESGTTVATTPNPSDPNTPVTISATVASARDLGDPTPTGTVTFTIDGGTPVSAALVAGVAEIPDVTTLDPGTHTIVATYSGDSMYATSTGTADHGVRPIADAGGPYALAEGATLTLQAGAGTTAGVTYGWDLDGKDADFDEATGESPTLTWDQLQAFGVTDGPDTYPVRLRVTIDNVDSEPANAELTVTNTAPTSVLKGDLSATVGVPFTIKVGANDPSSADMAAQFTYTVDWGDGSPETSVPGPADPPVTHVYVVAGNYTATFTATDKDGGTGPGTQVVVTAEQAQVATPTPTPSPSDDDGDDNAADGSDGTSSTSGSLASTGSAVGLGTFVASLLLLGGGVGLLIAGRRRSGRREG